MCVFVSLLILSFYIFQVSNADAVAGNHNNFDNASTTEGGVEIEILRANSDGSSDSTNARLGDNTLTDADNLEDTISVTDLLDDEEIENILDDKSGSEEDGIIR